MTGRLRSRRDSIAELFAAKIETLTAPPRYYRSATRRFLSFLQTHFPDVRRLSQLRREPHLIGWVHSLAHDGPLSDSSRRIYLVALRRLLREFINDGHAIPSGLILPEDFPARPSPKKDRALHPRVRKSKPPRSQAHPLFLDIFDAAIQTLALTSRPNTVHGYRAAARRFLCYLYSEFPQLAALSQLSRDPHLLGWFRRLAEQDPPLSPGTRQLYLLKLRRLLQNLDSLGYVCSPTSLSPPIFLPYRGPARSDLTHLLRTYFKKFSKPRSNVLRPSCDPALSPPIVSPSATSSLFCNRSFRSWSKYLNCGAILTCSPGSATSASAIPLCPPTLARNTCSRFGACSRSWLHAVMTYKSASLSERISRHCPTIFPAPFPPKTINASSKSSAAATICFLMHSCSLAPLASASENASILPPTA